MKRHQNSNGKNGKVAAETVEIQPLAEGTAAESTNGHAALPDLGVSSGPDEGGKLACVDQQAAQETGEDEGRRDGTDAAIPPADHAAAAVGHQLSLKQKLVEVRRRIGLIEKRGVNQAGNYKYVRAADLAGPVGDLLAELGVVLLPRLESLSSEPLGERAGAEDRTRVVVAYTFMDANSSEELTVKMAGAGIDPGDKATCKAQTAALKYALLQTFLIATGDDPESECLGPPRQEENSSPQKRRDTRISAAQVREINQLIEETDTERERVLEYFKITAIKEMNERSYQKAMTALRKKLAKATAQEAHAA